MSTLIATDAERIPFARSFVTDEARAAVERVLTSGWLTTGPEVLAFEREFAEWLGADDAVAVASCTAAIELSLRAMRLPAGSAVLTSTMTFCGAVNAILHAGLEPVLVDVDPHTLMPNEETTAEAVRAAGGRVAAMVVVHYAGHPAAVASLAAAAGLPLMRVVEDAAHAIGASVEDRKVGTISAATCFSFYATKNLPIGEGGMIASSDGDLVEFVRRCRLHGMSRDAWRRYLPGSAWRYDVVNVGLKANMTDVQAAIGRAHLMRVDAWQRRRETIVERYRGRLSAIPGIRPPEQPANGRHAWHLFVLRVAAGFGMDRDRFIEAMSERGVDCSVHFIPIHHHSYYARRLAIGDASRFPHADTASKEIVSLPLYPSLTDAQVDRVCDAIDEIASHHRPNGHHVDR